MLTFISKDGIVIGVEQTENTSRATKNNLSNASEYVRRGIVFAKYMIKYYDAIKDFDKAIELDPNFAEAYFERGKLHYKSWKKEQAIQDCSKAVDFNSDYDETCRENFPDQTTTKPADSIRISTLNRNWLKFITDAAESITIQRNTTGRFRISTKLSNSIRISTLKRSWLKCTTNAVELTTLQRNMTWQFKTTAKLSNSSRRLLRLTTAAPTLIVPKNNTSKPLKITPKLLYSIRDFLSRLKISSTLLKP